MRVGECWPMNGTHGYVVIRFENCIKITNISISHIKHTIAPMYESAPRSFKVFGLRRNGNSYLHDLLLVAEYKGKQNPVQYFKVNIPEDKVRLNQ